MYGVYVHTVYYLLRLEFGTAPAAEPGAPPVITNDILAMVSPEKESVPLQKVEFYVIACIPACYLLVYCACITRLLWVHSALY